MYFYFRLPTSSSHGRPSLSVKMANITGKYDLVKSENFDEYMEAVGEWIYNVNHDFKELLQLFHIKT